MWALPKEPLLLFSCGSWRLSYQGKGFSEKEVKLFELNIQSDPIPITDPRKKGTWNSFQENEKLF